MTLEAGGELVVRPLSPAYWSAFTDLLEQGGPAIHSAGLHRLFHKSETVFLRYPGLAHRAERPKVPVVV